MEETIYYTKLYFAVLHCAKLYCAISSYNVLYYDILHYIIILSRTTFRPTGLQSVAYLPRMFPGTGHAPVESQDWVWGFK